MAQPTLSNSFIITLGDGGDPETFAFPCGANARSVTLSNNLGEEVTLDCTDPVGAPAAIQRWLESQDTSISISGRVSTEGFATWRAWADDGGTKNIRIEALNTSALGGGHWELPAICQSLEISAEGSSTAAFSADIVGAGARTWTAAT